MSSHEEFKVNYEKKPIPGSILKIGAILSIIGAVLVGVSLVVDPTRSSFNSIVMFAFMLSIALGSMFVIALEYVAGAVWSVPFRRIAEGLGLVIFIVPLFALPGLLNIHTLFHWTHPDVVAADAVLKSKAPYLNITFFYVRFIMFFLLWFLFYYLFTSNSQKQDITGDQKHTKRNIVIGALFIPVFAITLTLTAIDWLMSLAPHWFSTIFGVYYFAGTVLAAISMWAILSITLNENGILIKGIKSDHYYSFGALLFAFINFWGYIAFSQFLLIWYANLPEETVWFIARGTGSWMYFSLGLLLVHFIIPYAFLLPQPAKMDPKRVKYAAMWILFAHFYDLYWLVMPTYDKKGMSPSWMDIAYPVLGIGLILVLFSLWAKNRTLVPIRDPKMQRSMDFTL